MNPVSVVARLDLWANYDVALDRWVNDSSMALAEEAGEVQLVYNSTEFSGNVVTSFCKENTIESLNMTQEYKDAIEAKARQQVSLKKVKQGSTSMRKRDDDEADSLNDEDADAKEKDLDNADAEDDEMFKRER